MKVWIKTNIWRCPVSPARSVWGIIPICICVQDGPEKADGFEGNRRVQEIRYDLMKWRNKQYAWRGSQIRISLNNYILNMYTFPGSLLLYFQCKDTHDCPRKSEGNSVAVSCWQTFSGVRRLCKHFSKIILEEVCSRQGYVTLVAITCHPIEIMHPCSNFIGVTQSLHHLHFVWVVF